MTKEAILRIALHLFSQKGYSATSIREIARAVGIKESSIYAHFASKEDIFRSVIANYDFLHYNDFDIEEFKKDPLTQFRLRCERIIGCYDDEDYMAYARMSQIECLKDGVTREMVRSESFDRIESFFEQLLTIMIDIGYLHNRDKNLMMAEYVGPFYYLHMKLLTNRFDEAKKIELIQTIRAHLVHFFTVFRKETPLEGEQK